MGLTVFKDQVEFRDQVGQFWNVLDLVEINSNLRIGDWNYHKISGGFKYWPKKKKKKSDNWVLCGNQRIPYFNI